MQARGFGECTVTMQHKMQCNASALHCAALRCANFHVCHHMVARIKSHWIALIHAFIPLVWSHNLLGTNPFLGGFSSIYTVEAVACISGCFCRQIHEEVKLALSCCCRLAVLHVLPSVAQMTSMLAVASATACCRSAGSGLVGDVVVPTSR